MLNLIWLWPWSEYREVFVHSGVFIIPILEYVPQWFLVGTCVIQEPVSQCEISRWTGSCMIQFLLKGHSKQTMIHHFCGSGKYTAVSCFSIRGNVARWCPGSQLGCGGFPGTVCCARSSQGWGVFTLVQVRLGGAMYVCVCVSLSLSLSLYIYIYIYR